MTTNDTENVVNQMNDLAVQTTQTLVDAAYLAQQQSGQLIQAWLDTLGTGQKQQREIATQLVKQTQEAQSLLGQYVQQSIRNTAGAYTNAAQTGFQTVSETVNRVNEQVDTNSRAAEGATGQAARNNKSGK